MVGSVVTLPLSAVGTVVEKVLNTLPKFITHPQVETIAQRILTKEQKELFKQLEGEMATRRYELFKKYTFEANPDWINFLNKQKEVNGISAIHPNYMYLVISCKAMWYKENIDKEFDERLVLKKYFDRFDVAKTGDQKMLDEREKFYADERQENKELSTKYLTFSWSSNQST
jgi:hypothetical protein